ncbi:hypothetical protein DFS34DRAFT_629617 [Phlyctochytrium arcticum]|nr:hypothetical protein DFS34DRAFT_629617 [Phlyctochytrium arcticum]
MGDPDGLEHPLDAVWEVIVASAVCDWGLYDTVSTNLDKTLLEHIVSQRWSRIQDPEHRALRAGLVLAVLIPPRRKLMADAKPAAEELLNLAKQDSDEYVRTLGILGANRISKGQFDVTFTPELGPHIYDAYTSLTRSLSSADLQFYPKELCYLNDRVVKSIKRNTALPGGDENLVIKADHKVPSLMERMKRYGIKREPVAVAPSPTGTSGAQYKLPSPSASSPTATTAPTTSSLTPAWMLRKAAGGLKAAAYGSRRSSGGPGMRKGFERERKVAILDINEIQKVETSRKAEEEERRLEKERKAQKKLQDKAKSKDKTEDSPLDVDAESAPRTPGGDSGPQSPTAPMDVDGEGPLHNRKRRPSDSGRRPSFGQDDDGLAAYNKRRQMELEPVGHDFKTELDNRRSPSGRGFGGGEQPRDQWDRSYERRESRGRTRHNSGDRRGSGGRHDFHPRRGESGSDRYSEGRRGGDRNRDYSHSRSPVKRDSPQRDHKYNRSPSPYQRTGRSVSPLSPVYRREHPMPAREPSPLDIQESAQPIDPLPPAPTTAPSTPLRTPSHTSSAHPLNPPVIEEPVDSPERQAAVTMAAQVLGDAPVSVQDRERLISFLLGQYEQSQETHRISLGVQDIVNKAGKTVQKEVSIELEYAEGRWSKRAKPIKKSA